jgi:DNA repair protein SbcC/Rad50
VKILELRFKNLNSLYGEWKIDFTNPEYASHGIFALTGPTGAGKSTILDALCLALYGATPRLGKISKSGNEIMSRQTGECYAEVLFESQAGQFRCHWEQRRARKRAEGKLQDQEHQIVDGITGKPIETKKSLVTGVIEEKTGMDFDRFTRSILLAQGGFDTFLKANEEEKSRILEQITGTDIYSEISKAVHERLRQEQEKLNLLGAETAGMTLLEPEEEAEIKKELDEKREREKIETEGVTELIKAAEWLKGINSLNQEITDLKVRQTKLQSDQKEFEPNREKLKEAEKAAILEGNYVKLSALREEQSKDRIELKREEILLPERETTLKKSAQNLKEKEIQLAQVKKEREEAAPRLQKVRLLDQKIAQLRVQFKEQDTNLSQSREKLHGEKTQFQKNQKRLTESGQRQAAVTTYLQENRKDSWLVSGLTGLEEQLVNLHSLKEEISHHREETEKTQREQVQNEILLKERVKGKEQKQKELTLAEHALESEKKALETLLAGRQLREYRAQKDGLLRELALLQKIADLEELRTQLEEGKPCPLCGSAHHPFAEGNTPAPGEKEKQIAELERLITRAEEAEEALNRGDKAITETRSELREWEQREETARLEIKRTEKAQGDLEKRKEELVKIFSEREATLLVKLTPLGISQMPQESSSLLNNLKGRLKTWEDQINLKEKIEKESAQIESESKRLDGVIETQVTALAEKEREVEALTIEETQIEAERKELFGTLSPDEEETRLKRAVSLAEEEEVRARRQHGDEKEQFTAAQTRVDSLRKRVDLRQEELNRAEGSFITALTQTGFTDESAFCHARLSQDKKERLGAEAKRLDQEAAESVTRLNDREERLCAEKTRNLSEKNLDEVVTQTKLHQEALSTLRQTIADLHHRLDENKAARERIKEQEALLEAQKRELRRWEKLHILIGSADGKKYRTFAQGLTFELMISHANTQLAKMTGRYLLMRDEEHQLELNVVDNYQAGEIRSTKNLSGGESFIVSLALALGLSRMASRKVRVDSLFLDEGFGTLDEEALETALETLSGLQQEGKLIGIISHVSALKERIGTQIAVEPLSGGRSGLQGPGCKKL